MIITDSSFASLQVLSTASPDYQQQSDFSSTPNFDAQPPIAPTSVGQSLSNFQPSRVERGPSGLGSLVATHRFGLVLDDVGLSIVGLLARVLWNGSVLWQNIITII
jgi:hypothetical protein